MVTGALAIAAIVLVQGAGVAESAPNPGNARPDPNRDIVAQGAGNLAAGFFRGIPVGGSVGQTALNVAAGSRTRWAAIWSGVWMLVILAVFSGFVAKIAVPALSAILIFAAIGSLRPGEIASILRSGRISQVVVVTTFAATLFLPVAAAVGIGVALSLILQLNQEAMDLTVVELVPRDDGQFEEQKPPKSLTSFHITVLDVYGSLLYAGARTLQAHLPDPGEAQSPVVVLRLRRPRLARIYVRQGDQRLRRPAGRIRWPALSQRPRPEPDRAAPAHRARRRSGARLRSDLGRRGVHPCGLPRRRSMAGQSAERVTIGRDHPGREPGGREAAGRDPGDWGRGWGPAWRSS